MYLFYLKWDFFFKHDVYGKNLDITKENDGGDILMSIASEEDHIINYMYWLQ